MLESGDILVNINNRHDPWAMIKRWAIGPYEHVFMYMGKVGIQKEPTASFLIAIPMLFESNGRGVAIQSLSNRYGQKVVVLRLKSRHDKRRIPHVLDEAIRLASNPQSYYDYFAIARWVIPRILREKFHLPIPLAWHRDERQICSEAVFEIFYRAKLVDILPSNCIPPMPGDFVTDSALLEQVWSGKLSENLESSNSQIGSGPIRN